MNDPAIDTAALPQDGLEHRLHPLSWLFVLLAHLWQFIPALVLLLFAGRGHWRAWLLRAPAVRGA